MPNFIPMSLLNILTDCVSESSRFSVLAYNFKSSMKKRWLIFVLPACIYPAPHFLRIIIIIAEMYPCYPQPGKGEQSIFKISFSILFPMLWRWAELSQKGLLRHPGGCRVLLLPQSVANDRIACVAYLQDCGYSFQLVHSYLHTKPPSLQEFMTNVAEGMDGWF